MNAKTIIEKLAHQPLPGEGGFYKETYRAAERIPISALPKRYSADKCMGTAIYYLLTPDTFSALHRLPADEIFHFYLGDPVILLQLSPDGTGRTVTIGNNILAGETPQWVVPRQVWQGTMLPEGGKFALLGTTMAPGFDFADCELGNRAQLLAQYSKYAALITRLTKE
jgi:uncharacterized protein